MRKDRIWITWERQRRNITLSQKLSAEYFELSHNGSRIMRYLVLAIKTIGILFRNRKAIAFVQNPSILLAIIAVVFGKIFGTKVIVDAHNAGVYPAEGKSRLLTRIVRFLFKGAYITIVTNQQLKSYVEDHGGRAETIPDPIPDFHDIKINKTGLADGFNALFICTWAADEPYLEVIEAGRLIDDSIHIYITGNPKNKLDSLENDIPPNIHLSGFLPEDDFINMLHSCDVVVDLTMREDCLVCGAYESVGAEKPLILSDTKALRDYFTGGVVYTQNTREDIANSLVRSKKDRISLEQDMKKYKRDVQQSWGKLLDDFNQRIAE